MILKEKPDIILKYQQVKKRGIKLLIEFLINNRKICKEFENYQPDTLGQE